MNSTFDREGVGILYALGTGIILGVVLENTYPSISILIGSGVLLSGIGYDIYQHYIYAIQETEEDMLETISYRLSRLKEADDAVHGRDKPSKVVYCTKCDEYEVGRYNHLDCHFMSDESDKDHLEYQLSGAHLEGYIRALEWIERSFTETKDGEENNE